jgi:4-hydroxybenzoate polyprenyltransferase
MRATATAGNRWWIYQRERFPLLTQGPVIAAFSFSAVSFSALVRHRAGPPPAGAIMVAFVTSFVFFLQLRIADEFKDADDDARYRSYRPVPRGLVRLPELAAVAVGGALVQLLLALWLDRKLIGLLIVVWLYLGLMSREFFMSDWLKAHPFTYMWTHMLIIPLIDLYTSACDWLVTGAAFPHGLHLFLATSYCNGMVVEIGRKIRAPEDEERGVETYTAVWGRRTAVLAWLGASTAAGLFAACAAGRVAFVLPTTVLLVALLGGPTVASARFLRSPVTARAAFFEPVSGLWTLLIYLGLGIGPWLARP